MEKKIFSSITKKKATYLGMNVCISIVGFFKSYVYMKSLNDYGLGLMTIIQTIMLFVSIMQFGVINGGYRIFATKKGVLDKDINNLIYSLFALFYFLIILFLSILLVVEVIDLEYFLILSFSVFVGIIALYNNWITNMLISKDNFSKLSVVTVCSGIGSLLFIPILKLNAIFGSFLVFSSQYFLFFFISFVFYPFIRPTKFYINFQTIKVVLDNGFVPYLCGVFVLLNTQIEKIFITNKLGIEGLGKFYILYLFNSLFQLFPSSLLNILFPKAILYDSGNNNKGLYKLVKIDFLVLLLYYVLVLMAVIIFLRPLVYFVLPQQVPNIDYIIAYLPGLFFLLIADPIALVFNARRSFMYMFFIGVFSLLLTVILFVLYSYYFVVSPNGIILIKNITNTVIFIVSFFLCFHRKVLQ